MLTRDERARLVHLWSRCWALFLHTTVPPEMHRERELLTRFWQMLHKTNMDCRPFSLASVATNAELRLNGAGVGVAMRSRKLGSPVPAAARAVACRVPRSPHAHHYHCTQASFQAEILTLLTRLPLSTRSRPSTSSDTTLTLARMGCEVD